MPSVIHESGPPQMLSTARGIELTGEMPRRESFEIFMPIAISDRPRIYIINFIMITFGLNFDFLSVFLSFAMIISARFFVKIRGGPFEKSILFE